MNTFDAREVKDAALRMRRSIVEMLNEAGSGHPGGSLSAADIVATLYFGGTLSHDPENSKNPHRDRFILSKGHAAPVLYAVLAEAGYLPKDELKTLRKLGSRLQGHPDSKKVPGVEVSTGSLGQGLSISCGSALALKQAGGDQHVFTLMGDGELQEGQVWEAAMFAAHNNLDNLIAIVDHNNLQIDGHCTDVMCLGDIAEKFKAFGWNAVEVDGHDVDALHAALETAKATATAPTVLVARTVKGKGVSFMENLAGWHGVAPNDEQCACALDELGTCECAPAGDITATDAPATEGGR